MFLEFTTLTRDGQCRDFSCQLNQLEAGLDVLLSIVKMGDQVINASLIDGSSRLPLPTEVFYGETFTQPIEQLKHEWEGLLAQPPSGQSPDTVNWRQTEIIEPLMALNQQRIDCLQNALNQMQQLLHTTKLVMRDGSHKTRLVAHYEGVIGRYVNSLSKLKKTSLVSNTAAQ